MLKYRGKYVNITFDDFASLTREKFIEIIPIGKENFDLVTVIDLIDAITKDYICLKLTQVVYVCSYWWSNNFSRSPNTRNQAQNLILKINEKLIHRV